MGHRNQFQQVSNRQEKQVQESTQQSTSPPTRNESPFRTGGATRAARGVISVDTGDRRYTAPQAETPGERTESPYRTGGSTRAAIGQDTGGERGFVEGLLGIDAPPEGSEAAGAPTYDPPPDNRLVPDPVSDAVPDLKNVGPDFLDELAIGGAVLVGLLVVVVALGQLFTFNVGDS